MLSNLSLIHTVHVEPPTTLASNPFRSQIFRLRNHTFSGITISVFLHRTATYNTQLHLYWTLGPPNSRHSWKLHLLSCVERLGIYSLPYYIWSKYNLTFTTFYWALIHGVCTPRPMPSCWTTTGNCSLGDTPSSIPVRSIIHGVCTPSYWTTKGSSSLGDTPSSILVRSIIHALVLDDHKKQLAWRHAFLHPCQIHHPWSLHALILDDNGKKLTWRHAFLHHC